MLCARFVVDSTRDININDFQFGNQLRDFCLFSNPDPEKNNKNFCEIPEFIICAFLLLCTYWCNLKTFLNRKICLHRALVGKRKQINTNCVKLFIQCECYFLQEIIVLVEN